MFSSRKKLIRETMKSDSRPKGPFSLIGKGFSISDKGFPVIDKGLSRREKGLSETDKGFDGTAFPILAPLAATPDSPPFYNLWLDDQANSGPGGRVSERGSSFEIP
jgi:hypothetical protein